MHKARKTFLFPGVFVLLLAAKFIHQKTDIHYESKDTKQITKVSMERQAPVSGEIDLGSLENSDNISPDRIRDNLKRSRISERAIETILDTYVLDFWQPFLLAGGDLNEDSQDDYVFYVEDVLNKHREKYSLGNDRKLVILLSQQDTGYQVSPDAENLFILQCGECGGFGWGSPMVNASIEGGILSIREATKEGGSAWIGIVGNEFVYKGNVWRKTKSISNRLSLNDPETTSTYSETAYMYTPLPGGGYAVASTTKETSGPNANTYYEQFQFGE